MSVVAQKGTGTNQTALEILLAVVAIMSPLVAAVGAVIDGEQKVRDSNGYLVWVSTADYSSILALTLTALIVVAVFAVVMAFRAPLPPPQDDPRDKNDRGRS